MPRVMHLNKSRKGSQKRGRRGHGRWAELMWEWKDRRKAKVFTIRNGEENSALKNTRLVITSL